MTNLELVAAELEAAKKKHPRFIDRMTCLSDVGADTHLDFARHSLDIEKKSGDVELRSVLVCEFYEALQAYAHGDLAHARQELAQCAAVCVRAMEEIEKEMEAKK